MRVRCPGRLWDLQPGVVHNLAAQDPEQRNQSLKLALVWAGLGPPEVPAKLSYSVALRYRGNMYYILLKRLKARSKSSYLHKVEQLQQETLCMFGLAVFWGAEVCAVPQLLLKLQCPSTRTTCTFPNKVSKAASWFQIGTRINLYCTSTWK